MFTRFQKDRFANETRNLALKVFKLRLEIMDLQSDQYHDIGPVKDLKVVYDLLAEIAAKFEGS